MQPTASLLVGTLCAGLIAGCGNTDVQPDRKQLERRVGTLVGDTEGAAAEAECTPGAAPRAYTCHVSVNGAPSTYDASVSADGEKIELKKR